MQVDRAYIKEFILGGKCSCVIENVTTGNHFEYKVTKPEDSKTPMYFVKVKRQSMLYAGFIKPVGEKWTFIQGSKGQLSGTDIEIMALLYVLDHHAMLPFNVVVHHLGKCGRCGRKLSDPASIERGLGPECLKKTLFGK